MKPIRNHFEQQQAPVAGIAKDLHRLKADGAASAEELRQFIGQLRGRSPQEVMGVVAQSDLFRSILLAGFGCAVLLIALTIIPYALRDQSTPTATAKQPAANDAAPTAPAADAAAATAPDAAAATAGQPDLQRAADAMGIGDAAPPNSDTKPLDDKLDKLLDGID